MGVVIVNQTAQTATQVQVRDQHGYTYETPASQSAMNLRDLFSSGDRTGELGALGAVAGILLGMVLGSGDNPLLWASVGAVLGLVLGLIIAELR